LLSVDNDEAVERLRRLLVLLLMLNSDEKAAGMEATSTQGRGRPSATRARR
jgi:hypothetical protein